MLNGCLICGARALQELQEYRTIPRVTSDCKPWSAGGNLAACDRCGAVQKLPNAAWLEEIKNIYGKYTIYHQSGGSEQPIFDILGEAAEPRSLTLIRKLVELLRLPEQGRLLDFGCGTGLALRNFAAARPGWELCGSELSERALPLLRQIPGFSKLYTCPPTDIPERFLLIMLIHSLEHVLDPVATLAELRDRVDGGGHVFVQVPDCRQTPYDLIIADHLSHFTLESLQTVGERAGYGSTFLSDSVLTKELSWIGVPDVTAPSRRRQSDPRACLQTARHQIAWLKSQIELAEQIAAKSAQFGIFGTSISGTWLYGALRERIEFFVDENPGRTGRSHMGLPIYDPDSVPVDCDIFVPLIPSIASNVARRLGHRGRRYHMPPHFEAVKVADIAVRRAQGDG